MTHFAIQNFKIYLNDKLQVKIVNFRKGKILKILIKILIYLRTQKYKKSLKKHINQLTVSLIPALKSQIYFKVKL